MCWSSQQSSVTSHLGFMVNTKQNLELCCVNCSSTVMELDMKQVEVALADPSKKEDMVRQLKANIKTIEDEHGEKFEIIQLKDITVTPDMVIPTSEMLKSGYLFHDTAGLPLRDDDVLLISFPKTGNHWICNLIHYLQMRGPIEDEKSYHPPLIDMYPAETLANMPGPRIMCTHHKPSRIPADAYKGHGKLILLFRNPKDVAVSHFHHLKKMQFIGQMKLSWNCFIANWMQALIPRYYFFDFYNTWQKEITENKDLHVLLVYYENMQKDGISELRKVQEFLGLHHNDGRLQQILDKCSIDNLRSDVNTGKVKSPLVDKDGQSLLYRKGIIGDWETHFTVAQNKKMDAVIASKFKNSIFKCQY